MKLVIFGANGPVGRILTEMALDAGHTITAVTRHPDAFPITHAQLTVLKGDVFVRSQVDDAVAGHDAVLSVYGVPFSRKPITIYTEGMTNILHAMQQANVRRLVCVTSGATTPKYDPGEGFVFGRIIKPFFGRTLYEDMRRMEELVMQSGSDWTIARPARLVDTPGVTDYGTYEGYLVPGMRKTSRRDLADFMLKTAVEGKYLRKAVAVATKS